jgi:manganese-dependent inorganic pyrophosphatase
MRENAKEKKLDLMVLMLTDVLLEGSQILYIGDDETIHQAFNVTPKENAAFLPRIMSRKKQVVPMLSALWA